MTSITRSLPQPIKDLGASIIGQKCYVSLVENLNLNDADCLKLAVSKGLGIGLVAGGAIVKLPQALTILNSHSARGLSLSAYVLETLATSITLAYSYAHNFPFSTYGENLFITIQNAFITLLIISFPGHRARGVQDVLVKVLVATTAILASALTLYTLPKEFLGLLQVATLPISLFSKIPQIRENARTGSTGQLSTFAVGAQILGCVARLFTTATEVGGDPVLTTGFALSLVLNLVLGYQIYAYSSAATSKKVDRAMPAPVSVLEEKKEFIAAPVPKEGEPVRAYSPPRSSTPQQSPRPASPRAGSVTPGSPARKWARKLD